MREIWKDVDGCDGLYQVSDCGRVRSVDRTDALGRRKHGVILKDRDNGRGYRTVALWNKDHYEHRYVHRLVAQAFVENPLSLKEINHKDENKRNNSAENLEWCTRQYNNTYGGLSKRKMKPVVQFDMNGNYIASFGSIQDASEKTLAPNTKIGSVCRGERKSAGGFVWRYAS